MKKNKLLLIIFFILPVIIIILASFFASQNPDGLDFVLEKFNILSFEKETFSIFGDYKILTGIIGSICCGLAIVFVMFIINKIKIIDYKKK